MKTECFNKKLYKVWNYEINRRYVEYKMDIDVYFKGVLMTLTRLIKVDKNTGVQVKYQGDTWW